MYPGAAPCFCGLWPWCYGCAMGMLVFISLAVGSSMEYLFYTFYRSIRDKEEKSLNLEIFKWN